MAPTRSELVDAASHLHYEHVMLHEAAKLANDSSGRPVRTIRRVATDSMLVHARNLLGFLQNKGRWPDDVHACHYIEGWNRDYSGTRINNQDFQEFWDQVNKLVAHISYKRAPIVSARPNPRWRYLKIADVIDTHFQEFLEGLSPDQRRLFR